MIDRIKALLQFPLDDTENDALISELINQAKDIFCLLRYGSAENIPTVTEVDEETGDTKTYVDVPFEKYETWLVRATVELYNRIGIEGIISENVNGVQRSFDGSELSKALRQQIIPIGQVV